MSPQEVISIIQACKEAGVRDFSYGELSLSFGKPEQVYSLELSQPSEPDSQHEAQVLAQNEAKVRQDHLDFLRLSDPLAYEELIEQEELSNDR